MNTDTNGDERNDMTTTADQLVTPREDLNIGSGTAELLELVDLLDDGDDVAKALEMALLVLVDISGRDYVRPKVASPTKLANRALRRIQDFMELTVENQAAAKAAAE